jgi:AcrR family transcriptional regulator
VTVQEAAMRSARDCLLDAAAQALGERPWSSVRMVDVALRAGVSRQTLYNEFGSKDGLGLALAGREIDEYLAGVERALAGAGRPGADAGDRFSAATAWTLMTAARNPLVRSQLTAGPDDRPAGVRAASDRPGPSQIVERIRDRAVAVLGHGRPEPDLAGVAVACEAGVRLMLSYVVAPAPCVDEACNRVAAAVRVLLTR